MGVIRRFPPNTGGRDFVAGDIHGCFDQLERRLRELDFQPARDRLFSVGDLIDRGPDSVAAASWLQKAWFHAVMGNHEDLMLQALADPDPFRRELWVLNGGGWHHQTPPAQLHTLVEQVVDLPLLIEVDTGERRVGIVHADVPEGLSWQRFARDLESAGAGERLRLRQWALWSRARYFGKHGGPVVGIDVVYVGHTIIDVPARHANVYFIDTGAFLPHGQLTVLPL